MMSIEELITQIKQVSTEFGYEIPPPASTQEVASLKQEFFAAFQLILPEAYCQLLSLSNGINFNGLTIWPTHIYADFHESLLEANHNLRESFNDQFVYFGMMDEELYIYDIQTKTYQAIEYVGQAQWHTFPDVEAMLKFMLERAIS